MLGTIAWDAEIETYPVESIWHAEMRGRNSAEENHVRGMKMELIRNGRRVWKSSWDKLGWNRFVGEQRADGSGMVGRLRKFGMGLVLGECRGTGEVIRDLEEAGSLP